MKKPPCSEWNIWKGPEVEGTKSKGVQTLFIRSLAQFSAISADADFGFFRSKSKCSRVWFCKEFTDWKKVKAIAKHFDEVCIEVEPKCYDSIPASLRKKARIYLKVDTQLKAGDFICVGPAFSDESFEIGTGATVKPDDYAKDTRIA